MGDVLFHGGPCSGKHVSVADSALEDGRLWCGGMNYKAYDLGENEWLALPPSAPTPKAATATAKQAAPAFQGMMRALTHSGPDELRRAQAERRALLRIGRR